MYFVSSMIRLAWSASSAAMQGLLERVNLRFQPRDAGLERIGGGGLRDRVVLPAEQLRIALAFLARLPGETRDELALDQCVERDLDIGRILEAVRRSVRC